MKKSIFLNLLTILFIIFAKTIFSASSYSELNGQYRNINGINPLSIYTPPSQGSSTVNEASSGKASQTASALDELDKVMKDKDIWQEGENVKYAKIGQNTSGQQNFINKLLGQSDNNKANTPNLRDITGRVVDGLKNSDLWDEAKKVSPLATTADALGNFALDNNYRSETGEFIINQFTTGDYGQPVNPTPLGLGIMMGLGFTGLDLPLDIRDFSEKIVNWKWTWGHIGNTALTAAAVLPVIGVLKYGKGLMTLNKYNKLIDDSKKVVATVGKNGKRKIFPRSLIPNERGIPDELDKILHDQVFTTGDTIILRNGNPNAVIHMKNKNYTAKSESLKLHTGKDGLVKFDENNKNIFREKYNIDDEDLMKTKLKENGYDIDKQGYIIDENKKRIHADVDYCAILDGKTGNDVNEFTSSIYRQNANEILEEQGINALNKHDTQSTWKKRPLEGQNSGPGKPPYTAYYREIDKNGKITVRSVHLDNEADLKNFYEHKYNRKYEEWFNERNPDKLPLLKTINNFQEKAMNDPSVLTKHKKAKSSGVEKMIPGSQKWSEKYLKDHPPIIHSEN